MTELDLVQERGSPDNNRKEKFYAITPSGKLAVQLAEIRPRNP
jgi:DNA-binding PadR family transcriptional regulator